MMPGKLYETHIHVSDVERSIAFYKKIGMKFAHYIEERRAAFFWFGKEKEQMLGVWEVPEGEKPQRSHFAFSVTMEELVASIDWLKERGIEAAPDRGKTAVEPVVHAWMPAASVYFKDPDDHSLEFICILPHEPQNIFGTIYLSEWESMQ